MATTKEIVSDMQSISKVLLDDGVMYYIPDFQRNFVWGTDEINQLFSDFSEDTDEFKIESTKLEGYLLGNIVLIDGDESQSEKRIVVDGQQRLTTLSLISKALYSVVMERIDKEQTIQVKNNWYMKLGDVNKGFCILDDAGNFKSLKIQHDPSLGFGKYYKKLMQDDPNLSDDDITCDDDANVKDVYTKSYEYLMTLNDDQLTKFIAYYKSKIKLIVTAAPTEAKAFQLFEILNDRGRSLEPMDLIKNRFLKILNTEGKPTTQISSFNDNWKELMNNLVLDNKKKIASSTFLKQYIIAYKGDNVNVKNLFNYIKEPKNGLASGDCIIHFVDQMNKVSRYYKEIEKGNYNVFNDDQNMFILFKLLSIKQFHPILMLFYTADDDKKVIVLDTITRLGAAVVFSYTQTNYIETIIPGIIKNYLSLKTKNEQQAFENMIGDLNYHIEEKAKLAKAILNERSFVGRNGELHSKALTILKFVEIYLNANTKIQNVPKGKKITVEHILSKNIDMTIYTNSELGFGDDKERGDYKHRLGNLTLLYNTDNASVGNKKYEEKIDCYKGSDFVMTSTLIQPLVTTVANGKDTHLFAIINKYQKQYNTDNGHWRKENIEERSKDLSDLIYKILTQKL